MDQTNLKDKEQQRRGLKIIIYIISESLCQRRRALKDCQMNQAEPKTNMGI